MLTVESARGKPADNMGLGVLGAGVAWSVSGLAAVRREVDCANGTKDEKDEPHFCSPDGRFFVFFLS